MTDRELMQQALDALDLHAKQYPHMVKGYTADAAEALRARLAQPEQDYEAKFINEMYFYFHGTNMSFRRVSDGKRMVPQREWQGLTDEEMFDCLAQTDGEAKRLPLGFKWFAEAIEAKLREKNNAL
jgi:hypothetical protein